MNERNLKIFYEVATKLNMTEAAGNLFMSQPAVSQTIRDLETGYDIRFFDRIGKRLYLTQAGEHFYQYVRRILNLLDECSKTLKEIQGPNQGRLRIGASATIGTYILTGVIGKFRKHYPAVEVAITIENTRMITGMILENKVDFALVEGLVDSEEIKTEPFCDDELVFIVPPDHPWARMGDLDRKLLAQEKLIMREQGSGTREIIESVLRSQGVDYQVGLELGNIEAIKKAVQVGLGISCLSKRCVQQEIEDQRIKIVRFKGLRMMRQFKLIFHQDKYLSNLFRNFIDFCRKEVVS
ncbi:MAG: LysR family transcriptional regulator [Firmicutes bacterium]|nr:LysR family transcriptional regulator [Bacillota bacterium]